MRAWFSPRQEVRKSGHFSPHEEFFALKSTGPTPPGEGFSRRKERTIVKYYNVEKAAEALDAEVEDVRRLAAEIGARLAGGRLRISEDELAVIEQMLEDEPEATEEDETEDETEEDETDAEESDEDEID